jgi:hypothetical protein
VNTKYSIAESFLEKLICDIDYFLESNNKPNSLKYRDVVRHMRLCTKQATHEVESLMDPIFKCLNSTFYLNVFQNIESTEKKQPLESCLALVF